MKRLLFLSIFAALINSAEVDWKNTEISFQDLSQSISPINSLIDLSARAAVNSFSLEDALEKMPADDLKHVIANYWYQFNKDKLSKIASQKYKITPEHTLYDYTDCIQSVAISGDKIVARYFDKSAIIWDLNTGKKLHALNGHNGRIISVAISGDKVVTGSYDKTAIIWDLNTGKKLNTLNGHTDLISSVAVSGDKVVTGSSDKGAIIWDLNSGAKLHTLNGHTDYIKSIVISGGKIVTGSEDKTAIIWDLNTGDKLHTLKDHIETIISVAISGDKVVTGSWDKRAIIWNLTQPIKKLLSNETGVITFDSLIEIDKKLHAYIQPIQPAPQGHAPTCALL